MRRIAGTRVRSMEDHTACFHCEADWGELIEGTGNRFLCGACGKGYATPNIPVGHEHLALPHCGRRVGGFFGSYAELVEVSGYTPRLVLLHREVFEAMNPEEILDFIREEDEFVRSEGKTDIIRGIAIPLDDEQTAVAEESVHMCPTCGQLWPVMFMVHDELWAESGIPDDEVICKFCLEVTLGRKLSLSDLNEAPINTRPEVQTLFEEKN